MTDDASADAAAPATCGCSCRGASSWCQAEYKGSAFGIVDAANGKTIDIVSSFQLQATPTTLVVKVLLLAWMIGSFAYGWIQYDHTEFFLAYVTLWTMVYSIVYLSFSLLVSSTIRQLEEASHHWMVKATWIMYTNAVVHGLTVVLIFWVAEYSPSRYTLSYFNVFSHGISLVIVVVEGNWINKVPVRLKHYILPNICGILYVVWSVLQSLLPVTNPNQDDPSETGDYLYSILNWDDDLTGAIVVSVVVIFGVFPLFTLFVWGISLWHRRYLATTEDVAGDLSDVERAGAAAKMEDDLTSADEPSSTQIY